MHVLVLKCGIIDRTSSKNSFHTHFWHFSMRKPDKAAWPDKDTTQDIRKNYKRNEIVLFSFVSNMMYCCFRLVVNQTKPRDKERACAVSSQWLVLLGGQRYWGQGKREAVCALFLRRHLEYRLVLSSQIIQAQWDSKNKIWSMSHDWKRQICRELERVLHVIKLNRIENSHLMFAVCNYTQ
jgi:hypothetical protein